MILLLVGIGASLAEPASAQSALVAPRVMTQPQLPAPTNSFGVPVEGWAIVRYSVLEDGTASDVRVVEILPPAIDPLPAIQTVEQWTFAPGTRDGETIAWHNTESVLVFGRDEGPSGPSGQFAGRYDAIRRLLEAESYEEALAESESLLDECASRTEIGLALAQQAIAYLGLSDFHSALIRLRLASDPRIPSLPAAELLSALQLRFQIEVRLGRRREALETFQRIAHALGSEAANPYEAVAGRLAVESETVEALPVQARVEDEPWRITAARRTFTLADVEGHIRGIDVECDLRATRLEFQQNAEWSLPASWGKCELFIDADPGTSFLYYAFLDPQEPKG